jgi:hypothetical protein
MQGQHLSLARLSQGRQFAKTGVARPGLLSALSLVERYFTDMTEFSGFKA